MEIDLEHHIKILYWLEVALVTSDEGSTVSNKISDFKLLFRGYCSNRTTEQLFIPRITDVAVVREWDSPPRERNCLGTSGRTTSLTVVSGESSSGSMLILLCELKVKQRIF